MKTPLNHLISLSRIRATFLFIFFCSSIIHAQDKPVHDMHMHHMHGHDMEKINNLRFKSDHPSTHEFGKWETVIPEEGGGAIGKSLGMQTVHNVLLPSGKVLMTSGSSWRNLAPIQYYPEYPDPVAGKGLFDRRFDPFNNNKISDYYQLVNNTAIYDPEKNTFYRIHSPYPIADSQEKDHFIPNDFFCAGHLQLPNGNPFFAGGTQYYYPYRTGQNMSYIFDWRKELDINWKYVDWREKPQEKNDPWIFSGLMKRGRWYPTIVPLLDGRFVLFSGFVGFDKGYPDMYQFEINHYVEFFDPAKFDVDNPQAAWKAINVKNVKNSPFATKLDHPTKIENICYDMRHLTQLGFDINKKGFVPPCNCPSRAMDDFEKDAFKLYPHNYLFDGNKIYLTREGEWVSLRTANTEYMRRTFFTYWMDVKGSAESPKVDFRRGPNRPDTITSYGTSYLDPNTGNITILGGQVTSAGTLLPLGSSKPNRFAGGRGSSKIEQFHLNKDGGEGYWTETPDFMGEYPQDDRTMHYAIILPTRQILIINGGNYDFYGGVKYPILLTPIFDRQGKFLKYEKKRMAEAVEPRLYHNNAMLLQNGSVLVSGGNSGRATIKPESNPLDYQNRTGQPLPDPDQVELDLYFFTDGQMAKQEKGADNTPIENWTAEIFYPPYLFIDEKSTDTISRRATIEALKTKSKKGINFKSEIGDKTFYLLQSNQDYQIELGGILPKKPLKQDHSLVLLKLPSVTHGGQWGQHYVKLPIQKANKNILHFKTPDAKAENIPPGFYMLFYIDQAGKPSIAQMVRFDDKAITP